MLLRYWNKSLKNMAFKINISATATRNIDNAVEYYKNVYPSSAKNFKKKLLEGFNVLKNNPYFLVKYGEVRAFPVKKFPYLLLFDIDEKDKIVNILSVFCTHQNPEKYP